MKRTVLFRSVLFLVTLFTLRGPAFAEESEMHFPTSLNESRQIWLVPSLSLTHADYSFGGFDKVPGGGNGVETDPGVTLGLKILSSSNSKRTFLVGFDLRQRVAQALETRLGIVLEFHPTWAAGAYATASWYFGDTVVARSRDTQFNGNAMNVALGTTIHDWHEMRIYIEGSWGKYKEGPGFIYVSRPPNDPVLGEKSISIGVEVPFLAGSGWNPGSAEGTRVRPTLTPYPYQEPL